MASQPSPASSDGSTRKEVFLPRPPLPFDCDHEGDERGRNHDTDEDWLPEIKDILTGNFHVVIDMTSELDSEDDTNFHSRSTRSDSVTGPTTASPAKLQFAPCGQRFPQACQPPKAASSLDFEQTEILEQSSAVQGRPATSGPSDRRDDRDSGGELAPITAIAEAVTAYPEGDSIVKEWQVREKEDQEREETYSDGGPPKAPIPAFTALALEPGLISVRQNQEVVQSHCEHTQTASPIVLPVRDVAYTESCIGIKDITFLRVAAVGVTGVGVDSQGVKFGSIEAGRNFRNMFCSLCGRSLSGLILTCISSTSPRRSTSSVANRVQTLSLAGNLSPVEHRTLPRRLITTDDKFRQVNVLADTLRAWGFGEIGS